MIKKPRSSAKTLRLLNWIVIFLSLSIRAAAQPDPASDGERLEFRLEAPTLPRAAEFVVYLPPGYDSDRDEPYPLLILLHGHNMDLSTWDELGLQDALNNYAKIDQAEPYLIITVREIDNLIDLRASDFDRLILDRILPFIERNFNAGGKRDRRAVGGISRGALWAADIAFRCPEYFRYLGLHSIPGAPFYDTEFHRLADAAKEAGESLGVFFDIGAEDPYLAKSQSMVELLTKENIPFDLKIQTGDHSQDYWRTQLPDYLDRYGRSFINAK